MGWRVREPPDNPGLPPEVRWLPGWLDQASAAAELAGLLAETPWEDPVLRMGGRSIAMPRRVACYGPFAYAYSGLVHAARPLTPRLDRLRRSIEATSGRRFNTVLVNLYRSGADSVSWHSDDDYPHGGEPAVASLSLGATRRFRLVPRRGSGPGHAIDLTSGGLLIMEGRTQEQYRHALPKTRTACGPRLNLTFRHMAGSNVP
jgi:alkylated DNA repair dioxygenase AlkB